MRVADKVAEWLEQKNISQAFGIIGGGNCALFDAIHKRGFTHVCNTHHEQAAAMAAIYYWRTCRRLAAVLVTTGAGSSNALTGVLAAWMDGIPLLTISGNEASESLRANTRVLGVQGFRSDMVAAPMCKFTVCASNAKHVIDCALHPALSFAMRPPMGPVWVDIPKDIANAPYLGN